MPAQSGKEKCGVIPEFLECQDCGDQLRELSDAEAQKVANNPYNYVVFCCSCTQARVATGTEREKEYR